LSWFVFTPLQKKVKHYFDTPELEARATPLYIDRMKGEETGDRRQETGRQEIGDRRQETGEIGDRR